MDTFCPLYEDNPSTLSENARVQILRAIGVAIVKHGSMFPTMELLLRHAVNYLDMTKSKAVTEGGIIDDEKGLIKDFDKISLDESRAVLCVHMLCYVLDGSIGVAETSMWKSLLARVEECYQEERKAQQDLESNPLALRAYITEKAPRLAAAVLRVPATGVYPNELGRTELEELKEMLTFIDMPEKATHYNPFPPAYVCQQFRGNHPVSTEMIYACFDPEKNKDFMARNATPQSILGFLFGEATFTFMDFLTADPFAVCWPTH